MRVQDPLYYSVNQPSMRAEDDQPSSSMRAEVEEPDRLFATGQSVLHWWAGWFKTATQPKMHAKGQGRPAWFDATIYAALEPQAVRGAGIMWPEGFVYQVH